jgi:hypothetical protein
MIKKIIIPVTLLLLLSASYTSAQVDLKGDPKKAAAIADSIKKKEGSDTSKVKKVVQPLAKSVTSRSLLGDNASGFLFKRSEIELSDYKFTGDLFYRIPFGYNQSLGSPGMPDEAFIYGSGYGSTAYADDGISINNRISNSFDLTNFQSEKIDSIEVYPISKAFIYSPLNEYASVNFISRDRFKEKQYSRLRFYQGVNKEGFIDFLFNMPFAKKFAFTAEITNSSTKDFYYNAETGGWRASAKLRYNVSEAVNLVASYSYFNTETKLNGGVNIDSLKSVYGSAWEGNLYQEKLAFVNYLNRGIKSLNHAFNLRLLASNPVVGRTDASLYFRTGLDQFRMNDTVETSVARDKNTVMIRDDNRFTTYGAGIRQDISLTSLIDLNVNVNYEESRLNTPLLQGERKNSLFSASSVLTLHLLDSLIHPSVFVKSLSYNSNSYPGFGADINIDLTKSLFLFGGFSSYKKPYNAYEEDAMKGAGLLTSQDITAFETGVRYFKKDIDIRAAYFNVKNNNAAYTYSYAYNVDEGARVRALYSPAGEISNSGINLSLKFKTGKLLLIANAAHYTSSKNAFLKTPENTFDGGIFYVDTLLNKNLNLKAGFNFKHYTAQDYFLYDFEKQTRIQYVMGDFAPTPVTGMFKGQDVFRVDFFLAGRVQESAVVYLTFENLFDKNYFVVPYYPAMGRNFRFGISWEFLD